MAEHTLGLDLISGAQVLHILHDLEEGDTNVQKPVKLIANAEEFQRELDVTYAGGPKAPLSVYLIRNCQWAKKHILCTNSGISANVMLRAAFEEGIVESNDAPITAKAFEATSEQHTFTAADAAEPFSDEDIVFSCKIPYAYLNNSHENSMIELRRKAVCRGTLSLWAHYPTATDNTGCIIIVDDFPGENAAPIKLPFYTNLTRKYVIIRSLVTAFLVADFCNWAKSTTEELLSSTEEQIVMMKAYILRSRPDTTTAMALWRLECLLRMLDKWGTQTSQELAVLYPWWYYENSWSTILGLSTQSICDQAALLTAVETKWNPLRQRVKAEAIPAVEKAMQLLHTVAMLQEARDTAEQGESMRRLTWITFIFLPLMLVASVFGMNVDAFRGTSTSLGWFFAVSVPLVILVMFAWWIFKRYSPRRNRIIGADGRLDFEMR